MSTNEDLIKNLEWNSNIKNKEEKEVLARKIASKVNDGDVISFGSGTTSFLAVKEIAKKSHLKNAKEEIQRIIAAQISSDKYYKREEVDIEELQNKYEVIFDCLKHPQVKLESACFVWMVKRNDY